MNGTRTVRAILDTVYRKGFAAADESEAAVRAAFGSHEDDAQPWFIRAVIGVGTWLGALLLGFFLLLTELFKSDDARLVLGVPLFVASLFLSRVARGTAAIQLVFITSVTGQVLMLTSLPRHDELTVLLAFMALQAVAIFFMRNAIHRFASSFAFILSIPYLASELHWTGTGDALGLLLPMLVCAGFIWESELTVRFGAAVRPVAFGALFAWLSVLIVGAAADAAVGSPTRGMGVNGLVLEWPLLVTALLFLVFVGMVVQARRELGLDVIAPPTVLAVVSGLVVALVLREQPGLLAAVCVLALSQLRGERVLVGVGFIFLTLFLGLFYYQLSMPLLQKSVLMMGGGAALLVVRALIALVQHAPAATSDDEPWRPRAKWPAMTGLAAFGLTAAVLGGAVMQKESVLREGQQVFLELAPVDPRSLMQGDYMRLDYGVSRDARLSTLVPHDGFIVVRLDARNVASFQELREDAGERAPGTHHILYRYRGGLVRIGAESYLFEEGQAERYARARYGEVRVAPSGEVVLVGLADANLNRL